MAERTKEPRLKSAAMRWAAYGGQDKPLLPAVLRRAKLTVMRKPLAKLIALLTPKRSWLQFRLRTLFILVVVAAAPCGWLKWMLDFKARERAAVAAIEKLGGWALYGWEVSHKAEPPGAEWLRKLLGDDFFSSVRLVTLVGDNITDDSLVNLERLAGSNVVYVGGDQITDAGMAHLKGLNRLKVLVISASGLTDAGLNHLRGLTQLEYLGLESSAVTDNGIEKLQKAIPKCNITRQPWPPNAYFWR